MPLDYPCLGVTVGRRSLVPGGRGCGRSAIVRLGGAGVNGGSSRAVYTLLAAECVLVKAGSAHSSIALVALVLVRYLPVAEYTWPSSLSVSDALARVA